MFELTSSITYNPVANLIVFSSKHSYEIYFYNPADDIFFDLFDDNYNGYGGY